MHKLNFSYPDFSTLKGKCRNCGVSFELEIIPTDRDDIDAARNQIAAIIDSKICSSDLEEGEMK